MEIYDLPNSGVYFLLQPVESYWVYIFDSRDAFFN